MKPKSNSFCLPLAKMSYSLFLGPKTNVSGLKPSFVKQFVMADEPSRFGWMFLPCFSAPARVTSVFLFPRSTQIYALLWSQYLICPPTAPAVGHQGLWLAVGAQTDSTTRRWPSPSNTRSSSMQNKTWQSSTSSSRRATPSVFAKRRRWAASLTSPVPAACLVCAWAFPLSPWPRSPTTAAFAVGSSAEASAENPPSILSTGTRRRVKREAAVYARAAAAVTAIGAGRPRTRMDEIQPRLRSLGKEVLVAAWREIYRRRHLCLRSLPLRPQPPRRSSDGGRRRKRSGGLKCT